MWLLSSIIIKSSNWKPPTVSDVDGDGDFEFIVAGYGTNFGAGAPNLVLSYNKETGKLENLAVDDTESPYYNIRNDKGKAIGVAGML